MINCPECGKELKHKGALNGHLSFAHGIITPRGLTLDELRNAIKDLSHRLSDLETTDLSEKRMTRLCPHCDDFHIKANTLAVENRFLNEHLKQWHPDKPLRGDNQTVIRQEDGSERIIADRYVY